MRTNPRQRAPLTRCNAIDLQRSGHLPDDRENQNRKHAHRPSCGQSGSFQNLVLEGYAFGTVFLKPFFRGVCIRKDLEVIRVSDLLARIYVAEHGHCWTLADGAMRSGPSLRDGYALGLLTSEGLGLSPGSLE